MSRGVRLCALLLAGAVVVQQLLTSYPPGEGAAHVLWGGLSLGLLFLVFRGSDVARRIFAILAAIGACFALGALIGADSSSDFWRAVTLLAANGVQLRLMFVPGVRGASRAKAPDLSGVTAGA